jgi:AcrR family transcriptional regulator
VARTPDLERRQELLDRIVEYLALNGLAQATLRPMAASLNVSINRLVHHFGSKEELLAAALARSLEQQIAVQDQWLARSPKLSQAQLYRKWWRWINAAPANLALVRLNYEAAALDTNVSGVGGETRADQIGVWRHDTEQRLEFEGMSRERAAEEASLIKATFTGLVMDLLATGDRRRLTMAMNCFLDRLTQTVAAGS